MFPNIKTKEYMEPELSGIFWVKMVAKNIVIFLKKRSFESLNG